MQGELIAAGLAGIATYFEIDQSFTIPPKSPGRWQIWLMVSVFILINALLAAGLYALLDNAEVLDGTETWVGGLLVGAGYLSLVRLKFATVNGQPFGFEFFYDSARRFAYKRIRRRVSAARYKAAAEYAANASLADLIEEANRQELFTDRDPSEQSEIKAWILRVAEDDEATVAEKELMLADFILCGSRSSHS